MILKGDDHMHLPNDGHCMSTIASQNFDPACSPYYIESSCETCLQNPASKTGVAIAVIVIIPTFVGIGFGMGAIV
eukprot:4717942-Amphidinium_carterae.1